MLRSQANAIQIRSRAFLLPLMALLGACDAGTYTMSAPSSFLLTCIRPSTPAMVLRLDTGTRRFTVVNAAATSGGEFTITPYTYTLTAKGWTGRINRYDGQFVIARTSTSIGGRIAGKSATQPPTLPTEIWSCTSSIDKAKF